MKNILFISFLLILTTYIGSSPCKGQTDTEFWFAAPEVSVGPNNLDKPIVFRISTSSLASTVTVSQPANAGFTPVTVSIPANSTTTIDLSTSISVIENTPGNAVLNYGLLITATQPVTAYYEVVSSYCGCNPEIFSLKGKNALGTYFLIPSQTYFSNWSGYTPLPLSSFNIVATKDNTVVTITPSNNIVGHTAGIPFIINMNKGQSFAAIASSQAAASHLQGSVVNSNNDIAITISDDGLLVLPNCEDMAGDQIVPVNVVGSEYIVVKGSLNNERVSILGTVNNTNIYIDGNAVPAATIGLGQTYEYQLTNPSAYINASNPVYVLHCSGNGCEIGSALLPPIICTGSQQIGFTRSANVPFFLNLLVHTSSTGFFVLNGSTTYITPAMFSVVPGTGGLWSYAHISFNTTQIPISTGSSVSLSNGDVFHMGIINGGTVGGCEYGYFSNFNSVHPVASASPQNICIGDTTTLSAGSGATFSWTPATNLSCTNCASPLANPSSTTVYTVTVSNGVCSGTDAISVNVFLPGIADAGPDDSICSGQNIQLHATGGTMYTWSPAATLSCNNCPDPVATPTGDINYIVIASNGGCPSDSDTVAITVFASPLANAGVDDTICNGQSTILTATGIGAYSWSPASDLSCSGCASPQASPGSTITYTVSVSDAFCSSSDAVTVFVDQPVIPYAGIDDTICTGGNIQLLATGGSSYSWSPPGTLSCYNCANPIATPSNNMNYTVTVANGVCPTGTDAVYITVIAPPIASAGADDTICNGQPAFLNASGGITYSWSPIINLSCNNCASTQANPAASVIYTVTVSNGVCSRSDAVAIHVDQPVTAYAGVDDTICTGSNIQLNAMGGGTYSWGPAGTLTCLNCPNPVANPVTSTNYTVTVVNGVCPTSSDAIYITVFLPPAAIAGSDDSICNGQTAFLTASGGGTYSWSPTTNLSCINCPDPQAMPSADIVYTVTVSNGVCSASDAVVISVFQVPAANAGGNVAICQGDSIQLTATGGGSYSWLPATDLSCSNCPNPMAQPVSTTTYTVTVTSNICTDSDDIIVTVNNNPVADIIGDTAICEGEATVLFASGGTSYAWSTGALTSSVTVYPQVQTSYTVTASIGNCTDDAVITVILFPAFTVDAGTDTTIEFGESIQLNASGGTSWTWSPATGLSCSTCPNPLATPPATTTYTVIAMDSNQCQSTDQITISVERICGPVYLPNIFTPNGDDVNDRLYVRGDCIETMELMIYDRWGEALFTAKSPEEYWDGTFRGRLMDSDVFTYYLKATLVDKTTVIKKGTITMIR